MTEQYKANFEKGLDFQDYVIDQLLRYHGWPLIAYTSKNWQLKGETSSGVEIKYDQGCIKTGNHYIEVAEKGNSENANYVPSGIYRTDNSFLYLIGTYDAAYLFSKPQLQRVYESRNSWQRLGIRETEIPTSKGFLFPMESAAKNGYMLHKFEFYPTAGSNKYPTDAVLPWDAKD